MNKEEYTEENTIIELDNEITEEDEVIEDDNLNETKEEIVVDLKKEKKVKEKKVKQTKKKIKKASLWSRLSKKGKIIFIIGISLIVLLITGLLLYFLVFKKEKTPKKEEEDIIIEKDNYIYENGKLKFLNEDDKVLGTYKCKIANDKECYVALLSTEDTFDVPIYEHEDGTVIEKRTKIYNENYVFIYDNKKISLYDIKKETSLGEYSLVKTGSSDESLVVLKDMDDKYGLIKITSTGIKDVLDFEYEYLGMYNLSDAFVAKDGTASFIIDSTGKELSAKIRGEIKSFNEKYLAVYNDGYTLYDYEGQKVLENEYDYIDFNNNYIFAITGIKLYAFDSELYKLNEAAIKLKSTDYSKTYIFDKDNNLKETKKAYGITITNSAIEFEIDENTTKKINLYESAISKKYDFVNYFDGIIYIYSNEAKSELMGSYTCVNKNTVTSANDEFTNCFLAKEEKIINEASNGYIPILNNNYVFIKDNKTDAANPITYLYDIAKSKKLSRYYVVDTGIGNEKITHISATNNVIYAKNSEGNYGAITFGESGPKGLIKFKDDDGNGTTQMKLLGDNILIKCGEVNYLYTKIGEKLATSQFDIIDYKNERTLVKNPSGKYLIYVMSNGTSGSIITNEFDYIEMYDKYFVGITNKKLNVYYYTNAKDPLLLESLNVSSNNAKSFTVEETSKGYVIKITAGENATVDYDFDTNWSKIGDEKPEDKKENGGTVKDEE